MKTGLFGEIKQEVFFRQKILSEIYQAHGRKTVAEYVSTWSVPAHSADPVILKIIETGLSRVYGRNLARDAALQFKSSGLVSTVDHHGLFGHPFFLNSNLFFSQKPGIKYLLVFSTSGVSLNNSSWPGCLVLTHPRTGKLVRFSLFNDGHKTRTVFKSQKIDERQICKVLKQVGNLDFLEAEPKSRLVNKLGQIFLSPEILGLRSFSDQASLISHKLWQDVFPGAPQLVYLPLEDLVPDILINVVCDDSKNLLYQLFFTGEGRVMLDKYFYGARGGYGNGRGSFLFWGVDETGRRVALENLGGRLTGPGTETELAPEKILEALRRKKIYPTSLVCFLTMLFYGVTCVGGFNQTTWLTEIKNRFYALLEEMGEAETAERIKTAVTDNFSEGGFAFFTEGGKIFKASGLDVYLSGVKFEFFHKLAKQITLAQSIESELPEIYRIVVPEKDRRAELTTLNLQEILELNGLGEMIGSFKGDLL